MNWLKVEDKLPENDTYVIIYGSPMDNKMNMEVTQCLHFDDGCFRKIITHYKATHWMPMPKPPTE